MQLLNTVRALTTYINIKNRQLLSGALSVLSRTRPFFCPVLNVFPHFVLSTSTKISNLWGFYEERRRLHT